MLLSSPDERYDRRGHGGGARKGSSPDPPNRCLGSRRVRQDRQPERPDPTPVSLRLRSRSSRRRAARIVPGVITPPEPRRSHVGMRSTRDRAGRPQTPTLAGRHAAVRREGGGRGAGPHEDVLEVRPHRERREGQGLADLAVRHSLGHEPEDLALAFRQARGEPHPQRLGISCVGAGRARVPPPLWRH